MCVYMYVYVYWAETNYAYILVPIDLSCTVVVLQQVRI